MKRRQFLIRAVVVAGAVGGGFWLKDNVLWPAPRARFQALPQWVDLDSKRLPVPVVKARLGGRTVNALIDSGAQYSVVDSRLAASLAQEGIGTRRFDIPMLAYGIGGQAQVGKGVRLPLSIAGVDTDWIQLAILDLGPLASADGMDIGLIIGRDLMRQMVVELDLRRHRMRLSDPADWQAAPNLHPIPVRMSGDALAMDVTFETERVVAVLDTGASSEFALSLPVATAAGLMQGRPQTTGRSMVLGGMTDAVRVEVRFIRFGGEELEFVEVPVFAASALPNYPDALLGIEAFAGRELAIDLGRESFYLSRELDLTIG